MNINMDLFAQTNEGFHLVNEFTGTILYFGLIEKTIQEDQEGDKYFMFGGTAIYIIGFRRGSHSVTVATTLELDEPKVERDDFLDRLQDRQNTIY